MSVEPPVPEGKLDEIVDEFSVHRPKGRPKGTLARRQMKNKLNKHIAALIDAEVAKANNDWAMSIDIKLNKIMEALANTESMGGE